METFLLERNFFKQAKNDLLLKRENTLLFECQVFAVKKEDVGNNKIWFMRFYDAFILISQVFFNFSSFIFF